MPVDNTIVIDRDDLLPIALEFRKRLKCDPNKWNDSEVASVKHRMALIKPEYAGIPIDKLRVDLEALRKGSKLGRVGNHRNRGAWPAGPPNLSKEYIEYMNSPEWKARANACREFYDNACALCCGTDRLAVHHRHYETWKEEEIPDIICLCRECHRAADRRRKREIENRKANGNGLYD